MHLLAHFFLWVLFRLSAEQKGARIFVRVADDGRGIDRVRVRAKAIEKGIIQADAQLTDEEIAWKLEGTLDYQKLAIRSLTTMRPTTPLAEVEANRPSLDGGTSTPLYVARVKE